MTVIEQYVAARREQYLNQLHLGGESAKYNEAKRLAAEMWDGFSPEQRVEACEGYHFMVASAPRPR